MARPLRIMTRRWPLIQMINLHWTIKALFFVSFGKYNEAITYLDRALAIDPNYKEALNDKGLALYNLGRYDEAITYFDMALAIDPNYKDALR